MKGLGRVSPARWERVDFYPSRKPMPTMPAISSPTPLKGLSSCQNLWYENRSRDQGSAVRAFKGAAFLSETLMRLSPKTKSNSDTAADNPFMLLHVNAMNFPFPLDNPSSLNSTPRTETLSSPQDIARVSPPHQRRPCHNSSSNENHPLIQPRRSYHPSRYPTFVR